MLQTMELAILDAIAQLRCGFLDTLMPLVTTICDNGEVWILLGVCLLFKKRTRPAGCALLLGLILHQISCNWVIKPLVGRPRPFTVNPAVTLLVKAPSSAAFPSGHTCCSFASVAALRKSGNRLWIPGLVLAALIAYSRLYLYVHWPTDVLGGIVLGCLCGVLAANIVQKVAKALGNRKRRKSR